LSSFGAAHDDLERVVGQGPLHALASSQGAHPPFFIACQSAPASPWLNINYDAEIR